MVYINSRGEVIDDTASTPTNTFWKIITFFILFFKSMLGFEDKPNKKDGKNIGGSRSMSGGFHGGGGSSGDSKGERKFGPRGFKSITDLSPPPTPMVGGCSGGACG